jgi:hypothetical protein
MNNKWWLSLFLPLVHQYTGRKTSNEHTFLYSLFTIYDDDYRPLHVFICVPQADEMKWTCVCKKERRRERECVQLSHTSKRPSSVCLSRHVGYSSSKGKKKGKSFFSLFLICLPPLSLWMFLLSCYIHSIISHAVVVYMFLTISISFDNFNYFLWKKFVNKWFSTSNIKS